MKRPNARQRGYDRDWQTVRDAVVLERGCKCEFCGCPVVLRKSEAQVLGVRVAHIDHIKSIAEAPHLRLERSNLRCLCENCHDRHTISAQGPNAGTQERLAGGCDENGWPIDTRHEWNE